MSELYEEATFYKTCGLSVLPLAERKLPDGPVLPLAPDEVTGEMKRSWKPFQFHAPDDQYLRQWFQCPVAEKWGRGIGIIGGEVSGNLIILDFEDATTFGMWQGVVDDHDLTSYIEDAPVNSTPGGGMHILLRCTQSVPGNQKLAYWADKKIRIETRGEGGYVAAPPSRGTIHPTGGAYKKVSGSYATIPVLEPNIIDALLGFCTFFNEWTEPERIYQPAQTMRVPGMKTRPGDDFNERGDIRPTLEAHGWRYAARRGEVEMWTRPGKDGHDTSATLGYGDRCLFYVFSSNAAPFDSEKCYTIFAVKAILDHGENFQECARELGNQGYGTSKEEFNKAILDQKKQRHQTSNLAVVENSITSAIAENDEEDEPPATLLGIHELTDTGNAVRLVRRYKDKVRYDHGMLTWYIWNKRYWEPDRRGQIMEMAKITARAIYNEAAQCNDPATAEAIAKHAKSSLSADKLKAMVSLAKSDPAIAVTNDIWDSNIWAFNVANGTIDLRTKVFTPHSREDYLTHLVNIQYDPAATCPVWEGCIQTWQPSADMQGFLKRAVGYSMTGAMNEEVMFYLYGEGSNGKSKFTETMRMLMGRYWFKSEKSMFMKGQLKNAAAATPELVSIIGVRMVSVSEVAQEDRLNEAMIKDLTGNDTINARAMYKEQINFLPQCKIWFYGNHKPRVTGTDVGIWRRFLLIDFGTKIPEEKKDKALLHKLQAELPGILNWAVEGVSEWREHGLQLPREIIESTAEFRKSEDVIGRFIEEATYAGPNASATATELYTAYGKWCHDSGEYKRTQKHFCEAIIKKGFERQKGRTANYYQGIGVLTMREIENRIDAD